jgi:acetyltransferase-like isoleucine patch superfamily enzyme|tara:strand:+ start:1035 stop:1892 length:858 start_codon:yes stop_codon:yes gene_type:complete
LKEIEMSILTNKFSVGENSTIDPSAKIKCDVFSIGSNCYIGPNSVIECKEFYAGDYFFAPRLEVGRGGCNGPNSIVKIGNNVGIFEDTILNPSESITIGDNCGIGTECIIWTHGGWLDAMQGYPAQFASVTIGHDVWLPARSVVLPNVNIGNHVIVSTNSVVHRDLPEGCLAAGDPCKPIKENIFPRKVTEKDKHDNIKRLFTYWNEILLPHKGYHSIKNYDIIGCNIELNNTTIFECDNKRINGKVDDIVEDLRDFLRRNGIKIYTGKPFKSLGSEYEKTIKSR